jgi:translation initiation factor 2B subunit (eIF-2B alpha/beta/delta family)
MGATRGAASRSGTARRHIHREGRAPFALTQRCAAHAQVGSLALALAAKHSGKPVYAISDTSKLSPGPVSSLSLPAICPPGQERHSDHSGHLEEKGRGEVEAAWAGLGVGQEALEGLEVGNVYFELVPWALLDGVVTEKGLLVAEELEGLVAQRRREYVFAFKLEQ